MICSIDKSCFSTKYVIRMSHNLFDYYILHWMCCGLDRVWYPGWKFPELDLMISQTNQETNTIVKQACANPEVVSIRRPDYFYESWTMTLAVLFRNWNSKIWKSTQVVIFFYFGDSDVGDFMLVTILRHPKLDTNSFGHQHPSPTSM